MLHIRYNLLKHLTIMLALAGLVLTGCEVFEGNDEVEDRNDEDPENGIEQHSFSFSEGDGELTLEFHDEEFDIHGEYQGLTSPPEQVGGSGPDDFAAHIHYAGTLFNIEVDDNVAGSFDATFSYNEVAERTGYTPEEVEEHLRGGYRAYFNLHTEDHPEGELYVMLREEEADRGLTNLDYHPGITNTGENISNASGELNVSFDNDGVTLSGNYEDLTSDPEAIAVGAAAHLHYSEMLFAVPVDGNASSGSFEASFTFEEIADEVQFNPVEVEEHLRSGYNAYFNLHTETYAAGEIYGWVGEADEEGYIRDYSRLTPHPRTADSVEEEDDNGDSDYDY